MSSRKDNAQIDAPKVLDEVLERAVKERASDVHFEPTAQGLEVRLRIDGVLKTVKTFDKSSGRSVVTRLMVMAQLLTYRLDIPQEGRATVVVASNSNPMDVRVSVMPTTQGLRAAVRLPAELVQPRTLENLSLPAGVLSALKDYAQADSGMLILTGPAGSGKTTTIYALLEHIVQTSPGMSIVSLEDPVERDLPGVTQIEVSPFGELTYERALRSILRQDPQVLMMGEIRDGATASVAVQAALSGHRLISTLHAATPAGAIARLMEMGIEPYQITSALYGVVAQRLVRRKSDDRYQGRVAVAEFVRMDDRLRRVVVKHADMAEIRHAYAQQTGYQTMQEVARELMQQGITDDQEVRRVLGADMFV